MDQKTDEGKLEHQIELAERMASTVTDRTTAQRFRAFAQELARILQALLTARRRRQETKARAYQLWENAGRPAGRDQEFWLQAERELKQNNSD